MSHLVEAWKDVKYLLGGERASKHERQSQVPVEGGRRTGESPNPYLSARRTWNDLMQAQVASRRSWELIAILCLLITLASVGGIAYVGSQSKFIPFLYTLDAHGHAMAIGPVEIASPADPRVLAATVGEFIANARLVTVDAALQRKAVYQVYAMLNEQDPATSKMNQWMNGTEDSNPFTRAEKETVTVDISTVLPQTADTWEVTWLESVWDRKGEVKTQPVSMRALVTVYRAEPSTTVTEDELRRNPLSVYVRDFSWSKQL
ncbi:MAG: conjugal transfer protein TrbF [Nitrospira sp. HN-bin3]|uniref:VirB8/TrbF family protein n=1 Tax=Nitrospira cf. moscoviensis SBR1015 TaxID=96242 RepID=UPI000A0D7EE2|nr:VirB8/TrbF family protein [Nitrospira cf. moscoviensis SBR1015]OQW34830.1 MAG: conjugal transfer protein TrbF [Nitrospira sp. HN-bin3]